MSDYMGQEDQMAADAFVAKNMRYCIYHKVWFDIKKGCDECRDEGSCPYYGKDCPC